MKFNIGDIVKLSKEYLQCTNKKGEFLRRDLSRRFEVEDSHIEVEEIIRVRQIGRHYTKKYHHSFLELA